MAKVLINTNDIKSDSYDQLDAKVDNLEGDELISEVRRIKNQTDDLLKIIETFGEPVEDKK